jgi:hypothetical protein
MKVSITGHSKGLGNSIYIELLKRGHEVFGFSRSNGYDISDKSTRNKILENIKSSDIFINNAYYPLAQTELLEQVINQWQGKQKVIVNIGSKAIYSKIVLPSMIDYIAEKRKQKEIINQYRLTANPHIIDLTLGLVDTEMASRFLANKLDPTDVAKLLVDILELKDSIYVQELTLDVPFQDWSNISANK